ncbi:MAG: choice-of-anchor V domain-containing protein [Myxococcaceae bacterium]
MSARAVCTLLCLAASVAFARAGGLETTSCNGCHGGGAQQTTITLNPATFSPGATITVTVRISGSGSVGGLALFASSGTLATVSGQNTRLSNGVIVHSSPKAASGGAVTFDSKWTAPANPGGVVFDVATVLGNGDNSRNGDQSGHASASKAFGCAGTTYFRDVDGDGVGSTASGTALDCMLPSGFSATDGDCDDFDNRKTPGKAEACNGLDDNCNGQVDEGLTAVTTWPDSDGDGYGWAVGTPMSGCAGGNRATNDLDCDDVNRNINPGAMETCNQKDDDCDGQIDDGAKIRCGEGWCARYGPTCNAIDCVPGAPLIERCNALDDDCDGLVDDGDLCGAGAACQMGLCVEVADAGANASTDGGTTPSSPHGESTCEVSPAMCLAFLLPLLLRRRGSG